MASPAPFLAPVCQDAVDEIPIIYLGPYFFGEPGAKQQAAVELGYAFENIGFYFITNHGVPQEIIDEASAAAARFHAEPLEDKLQLKLNEHNIGYMPMRVGTTRHSQLNQNNTPNVNEAFFIARDLIPDDSDVRAGKAFRTPNKWL